MAIGLVVSNNTPLSHGGCLMEGVDLVSSIVVMKIHFRFLRKLKFLCSQHQYSHQSKVEIAQCPPMMDGQSMVYPHNRILPSFEKDLSYYACYNMDKS